jgi:PleD family two-component response regulator
MRGGAGAAQPPLLGYATAPGAAKGIWLGRVDFAVTALAGRDPAEVIRHLVPEGKRALAISNDDGAMNDLRARMSATHLSIAVVLDGRQAVEMLPAVRPAAAIVHLTPRSFDVFRTLAAIRAALPSGSLPILFLFDREPQATDVAFLRAGIQLLSADANFTAAELGAAIGAAIS